jgi:hypothetical protein
MIGCKSGGTDTGRNPIVGTWLVKDSGAPFPYHMYVFNADGTLQQANPMLATPIPVTATVKAFGSGTTHTDGG